MKQSQSTLLQIPLEIRHEIYSYILPAQFHVRLQDERLCVSICLEPEKDRSSSISFHEPISVPYNGRERWKGLEDYGLPHEALTSLRTYAERLQSTWGPHWMCEEHAQEGHVLARSLLLICRRIEVVDVLSRNFINVTDLETLDHLSAQLAAGSPSLINNVPPVLRNGITRLSITLRLPFAFFETTNAPEKALQVATLAWFWQQIGHMLSRLDSLTKLRLWFDHSNTSSWSLVNERNLLSPLLAHLSTTPLDVAMILPKLHPLHENEGSHFMNEHDAKPIRLHRTMRQGWHTLEGTIDVVKNYDFPITADLLYLVDRSCVIPGQDTEDLPLSMVEEIADLEEWERGLYKEGHDAELVEGVVRDVLKHRRELSGKSG